MEKKDSTVEIVEVVNNPLDPSTCGIKVILDLSRPNQLAADFYTALQQHPSINLAYRTIDPVVFQGVVLVRKGLSYRNASIGVCGHPGKAWAIRRAFNASRNAAIAVTGGSDEKH